MANKKNALKAWRVSQRKAARNRSVRSEVKTRVSTALKSLQAPTETEETAESILMALRTLDRAARKGVIHKNNAARRKSRLMKKYNAALAAAQSAG